MFPLSKFLQVNPQNLDPNLIDRQNGGLGGLGIAKGKWRPQYGNPSTMPNVEDNQSLAAFRQPSGFMPGLDNSAKMLQMIGDVVPFAPKPIDPTASDNANAQYQNLLKANPTQLSPSLLKYLIAQMKQQQGK